MGTGEVDAYVHEFDDESLSVLSGKRPFGRKFPDFADEIKGYSLKGVVGQMFCFHYDEGVASHDSCGLVGAVAPFSLRV